MINPHGAESLNPRYVSDETERRLLAAEAEALPSIILSSAAGANAVMLGAGYFTPLSGYMNLADAMSVATEMHTVDGLFWPVPVLNMTRDISLIAGARRIALRDPNVEGNPVLAVMDLESVEEITLDQLDVMTEKVFGTLDESHPGVAVFRDSGKYCLAGSIQVLNYSYFAGEFAGTFKTAVEIRDEIRERKWETVVAFQTRNPMHLAHEELCRIAKERLNADGIVIHMLLGRLKDGVIPANIREACIRTMVDVYFPENTVIVNGYGFDMLYAGPREAVLHALFRQNMGATHLIVGRDHAGVGDYYGPFDAQTIFDEIPDGALDIEIFRGDHTAWSKKLDKVVMMGEVEDHSPADYITVSGTRMRELLSEGVAPPREISRPEVAQILIDHYQIGEEQTAVGE